MFFYYKVALHVISCWAPLHDSTKLFLQLIGSGKFHGDTQRQFVGRMAAYYPAILLT